MEAEHIIKIAGQIAQDLARAQTDPNEVAKAYTYLRTHKDGRSFFNLLDAMVSEGGYLVRSGQTLGYYRSLSMVCNRHLRPYQDQHDVMAEIMGWAVRLLRYERTRTLPPPSVQAAPTVVAPKPKAAPQPQENADDMPQWKKDLLKARRNL